MSLLHFSRVLSGAPAGGGSIVDGGTYNFTSSLNESGLPSIQHLKSTIESAAADTALYNISALSSAGWINPNGTESVDARRTQIKTDNFWSGTKSFKMPSSTTNGIHAVAWNKGSTISNIYISWMVYYELNGATAGQWKMLRFHNLDLVTDDASPNIYAYLANWLGSPGDFFSTNGPSGTRYLSDFSATPNLPVAGAWYRQEVWFVPNTPGSSDGLFWCKTTRMSDGATTCLVNMTDHRIYNPGESDRISRVVFQNYFGNGDFDNGTAGPVNGWMDSIFVSDGTSAGGASRIELGDASTHDACVIKEPQILTTKSGTSRAFTIKQGAHSNLTGKYIYEWDASNSLVNSSGVALE